MASLQTIEAIKAKAIPILKRSKVTRAGIFGSLARGEQSDASDVDFLIEFDGSLLDKAGLKLELEDALNCGVDLVNYRSIYHRIQEKVLKEEIPIL